MASIFGSTHSMIHAYFLERIEIDMVFVEQTRARTAIVGHRLKFFRSHFAYGEHDCLDDSPAMVPLLNRKPTWLKYLPISMIDYNTVPSEANFKYEVLSS